MSMKEPCTVIIASGMEKLHKGKEILQLDLRMSTSDKLAIIIQGVFYVSSLKSYIMFLELSTKPMVRPNVTRKDL